MVKREVKLIGKRFELLKFRQMQGLTQVQMAAKLGITQVHYSRIETGEHNPSYKLLNTFKEVFGVQDPYKIFEKC